MPNPPAGMYLAGEWYPAYSPLTHLYTDVFRNDDTLIWNAPLPPTPTPVPTATATPQPGTIRVSVIACGVPFGTQIRRVGSPDSQDGVSSATFTVPIGQPITFVAAGYGDFLDTEGTAVAPASITIDMTRKVSAGVCGNYITPTAGPTATAPPAPPCQIAHPEQLQALILQTAIGTQAAPLPVPPGPLTLDWVTKGLPFGDATATTALSVVDVTTGLLHGSTEWVRPFNDETPASPFFALVKQSNVTDIQTSRGNNAWQWNAGWVRFTAAPLQVGHTYEINSLFVQAKSCNNLRLSGYVTVPAPDVRITVRQATLGGQDTGPIAQRPITAQGQIVGQTNAQGRFTYRPQPGAAPGPLTLQVVTPATAFTWTITGSCLDQAGVTTDLDTHTVQGITTGDCDLVWTQIPRPDIRAKAHFRNAFSGGYQGAPFGTFLLVSDTGAVIARVSTTDYAPVQLSIPAATLRTLVGSSAWSLSYIPPQATPPWQQTTPLAGTGGDLIADDLAITFHPGDALDNRFFIERDGSLPSSLLTIRGRVSLINQDGSVSSGAYGTVTAAWSIYGFVRVPVAADGTFEATIVNMAYSPTLTLSFQKSLATARYDHASPGTVDGQPQGVAAAPNQITGVFINHNGHGTDYQFVLRALPPPPPPPVASGELRLWMHSHLDPQQGVYRSTGTTVAWPLAEILDAAPAVTLAPLPAPPVGYRFEQRVVAWSYTGSGDHDAAAEGCRTGDTPPAAAGDTSRLLGCVYRYRDGPSAADMGRQARIFWGVYVPETLPAPVYRYQLPTLQRTDLHLRVLVETATVDTTTGQRWTQQQILDGSFIVRLAAPRTAK